MNKCAPHFLNSCLLPSQNPESGEFIEERIISDVSSIGSKSKVTVLAAACESLVGERKGSDVP